MSNYRSQMKAWAIDRVVRLHEATKESLSIGELKTKADELIDYAYEVGEDFEDCAKRLAELIKELPNPLDKVRQLQIELGCIEEEIIRHTKMRDVCAPEIAQANARISNALPEMPQPANDQVVSS